MSLPISPSELLMDYLKKNVDDSILDPNNIFVGPATKEAIEAGCLEIAEAGSPKMEPPILIWLRAQLRAVGPDLDTADKIGHHIRELVDQKYRIEATDSLDRTYLIHLVRVVSAPSHHWDSTISWESLQFAEMMVGLQALSE